MTGLDSCEMFLGLTSGIDVKIFFQPKTTAKLMYLKEIDGKSGENYIG
jgi:hypothetical protein